MAEHESEMKTWNVPKAHGKWYYPGTIAVCMAMMSILGGLLYRSETRREKCQGELKDAQNKSIDYLKEWANKAFDERYEEKEKQREPKRGDIKASVDSIIHKKL